MIALRDRVLGERVEGSDCGSEGGDVMGDFLRCLDASAVLKACRFDVLMKVVVRVWGLTRPRVGPVSSYWYLH